MQKQKVAKTFDFWIDSPKVSDSLLIHDSPKWILRYAQYDEVVAFRLNNDKKIKPLAIMRFGNAESIKLPQIAL